MEIGYTEEQDAMRAELRGYYEKLLDEATVAELNTSHGIGKAPCRVWKQMCADAPSLEADSAPRCADAVTVGELGDRRRVEQFVVIGAQPRAQRLLIVCVGQFHPATPWSI